MDDLNFNLFDDADFNPPRRKDRSELVIRGAYKKNLSSAQISFNRLTRRINKLQSDIETTRQQFDSLLLIWNATIPELLKTFSKKQLELLTYYDQSARRLKYHRGQKRKIRDMILALFVDAAKHLEPDEESLAVYERWAGRSFADDKREAFEKSRDEYEERIREMFGIDIDLSQYDESDESFARFNRELKDRMSNVEIEDTPARKQTQKQIEAEQRNRMVEHRRKMSLRSVYLGLVKALHPDIAMDALEGKRRDDLMKRVTVAYKEGDLQTLLRIEITEVERDVDTLDTLPDETLNTFIDSLKQQKAQLSCELRDMYLHPRYAHIRPYTLYGVDGATDLIDRQAKDYKRDIRAYDEVLSKFSESTPRHILIRIVENLITDKPI